MNPTYPTSMKMHKSYIWILTLLLLAWVAFGARRGSVGSATGACPPETCLAGKSRPTERGAVTPAVKNLNRYAFKMQLKPGVAAEYQKRHDEIWPELSAAIRGAGIADYSIFLDEETLTLFAVLKHTDNSTAADLPNHPIVKKWSNYMAPLMEVNPDNSPKCVDLKEVFHLD